MDLRSKRETFFFHNDLTCLVLSLIGKVTTVDLRNEASVTGLMEQVDGFMNVLMIDAIYVDSTSTRHLFDNFFIKARNIRYIHIPDEVRVISAIQNQLEVLQGKKKVGQSEKPKRTFRQRRLAKNQQETLKLIEEEKKKKGGTKKSL